jgi:hypothetical protein
MRAMGRLFFEITGNQIGRVYRVFSENEQIWCRDSDTDNHGQV